MAQKMSQRGVRPPAYPQVELLKDLLKKTIKCRHCGKEIDEWALETLGEAKLKDIQNHGANYKVTHKCGNVIKVI